jgi:hypothetical protein
MTRADDAGDADPGDDPLDLDAGIAAVYGGPLGSFVAERDGLARALRAAGRRDDAATVKALRKPKVVAWALDAAVHDDPGLAASLADAVEELGREQAAGGDVRAAIGRVRTAEGAVAEAASAAAARHGSPVDASAVGLALRAVVGDDDAFAALLAVRLVDVPAPGGLVGAGAFADTGDRQAMGRKAQPRPPSTRTSRRRPAASPDPAAAGEDAAPEPSAGRRAAPRPGARRGDETGPAPAGDRARAGGPASPDGRAARRAVAAAAKDVEAAGAAARKADRDADVADRAAKHAEDSAKAARRRADESRAAADDARSNADALAARLRETEDALAAAEDHLRALGG